MNRYLAELKTKQISIMSDIYLYYYFENGKVEEMKCDANLSVSEFIQKVKNYYKNNDELEDEEKPYSPPDLEDIRCAFLKGQKLQDNDLLKNHIDDLQKCPLFLSNDPTKSYEYNFTHIDLDDYENIQFQSKYYDEFNFKATEKKTKKEVFIKVYDKSLRMEDFYTDLQALNVVSALKHPGTVQIQGFRYPLNDQEKKQTKLLKIECKDRRGKTVEVDLTGFILIFEFMKNGSIEYAVSEYLKTGGQNQDKMNPTIRSKIIFGIASTMKIIHQKNAIHRDLKLQNIFLDENFEPRIGGFELFKLMKGNLIMTMSIVTPYYIVPEFSIIDFSDYDTFVDVYSYAFILYPDYFAILRVFYAILAFI